MKNNNKDLKSLLKASQEKTYMVSLLNSHEFKVVLRRYGRVYTRILFPKSKVPNRLQMITNFGDMILRITKYHGPMFAVKYLKALTVVLQRFVGGSPLKSMREIEPNLPLPRLASCGLPSFIPLKERNELKQLTPSVVRWWLTLFSIYRIISVPGKLKLETITAPYGGSKEVLSKLSSWLLENSKQSLSQFTYSFEPKASLGLERIVKASSSATKSCLGFMADAKAWRSRPEFFNFANFGQYSLYYDWFQLIMSRKEDLFIPLVGCKGGNDPYSGPVPLGQLALKEEPAGKIRVFAMVDIWTQSVLKPLHNWLFDLFRLLPNDSTHNQDVGFLRAKAKAVHYGHAWCYDLSAATDRLPIQLQSSILDSLFGHLEPQSEVSMTYGQAWAALLVNREYLLKAQETSHKEKILEQKLKYSVGQPMGAYSSWAMLNLCHHLILQYININLYGVRKWYENYEVLGDDIVIFDKQVADHYITLMEGGLDVKCNKSKSLLAPSRPVIEFAKRISIGDVEVSAFSWRMFRSFDSLIGRSCIAADIVSRRHVKSPLRAFKAIVGPQWGPVPSYAYSLISFAGLQINKGLMSFKTFSDFLVDIKNPVRFIGGRIIANVRISFLEHLVGLVALNKDLPTPKLEHEKLGRLFQLNQAAARGYLEDKVVSLYDSLEFARKNSFREFSDLIGPGLTAPKFTETELQLLFWPGSRFLDKVKMVDLDTLSFEELVDFVDSLEQLLREFHFFKLSPERKLVMDDSFKLLRLIMKARKRGSLSFERTSFR